MLEAHSPVTTPAEGASTAPGGDVVAVVDDDPTARRLIRFWLEQAGYRVVEHESGESAIHAQGPHPSVACVDLGLGEVGGFKVIQHLHAADGDLPIIVITAQREIETAVQAMRAGAYDYVTKPLDQARVLAAVHRARERRELVTSVRRLEDQLGGRAVLGSIVGQSPKMQELAHQVERILSSDVAVCISGESGTGKELVARAIHAGSPRRRGPFVAINCAGIPESLQESELFGHERGAFSGATQMRRGCFEQAGNGTLLLDEIGEMSQATQASLLRTLQEKTIRRVGGSAEIPVDVRILCATHRNLRTEVEAGRFREDLYFRLVVYPVHLPPLRDRLEDIPLLVGHFLRTLENGSGRAVKRIAADALDALVRYRWPGNVRELHNVVQRAILACRSDEIALSDLPVDVRKCVLPSVPAPSGVKAGAEAAESEEHILPLRELERRAIQRALRATQGSIGKAARLLGIGRATLYRRIATLDLSQETG